MNDQDTAPLPLICPRCHEPILEDQPTKVVPFIPRLGMSMTVHGGCEPKLVEWSICESAKSPYPPEIQKILDDGESWRKLIDKAERRGIQKALSAAAEAEFYIQDDDYDTSPMLDAIRGLLDKEGE